MDTKAQLEQLVQAEGEEVARTAGLVARMCSTRGISPQGLILGQATALSKLLAAYTATLIETDGAAGKEHADQVLEACISSLRKSVAGSTVEMLRRGNTTH